MRKWYYGGWAALACLSLVGCAERVDTVKQAEALAQLQAGRAVLGCREPCLAAWRGAQPQAAQLDAGARWQDLAMLVMRIGYQDDLSLYYLGRAAVGLGYRAAAARHYRQSTLLSGTSTSCQNLSRLCGGVALPRPAALRAAAIERELNRARPRRTGPASQEPETPAAAPEEVEAPAPSPVASPAGPPASEYIEPPPAAR
jgi:hypothetical protein